MFEFMNLMGNHSERVVAPQYSKDGIFVDTALVTDSNKPYETGIEHPNYNDGIMIIVELYDTKEEAVTGHNKWIGILTADKLPETIKDVSTAGIAMLCDIGGDDWRNRDAARDNCKPCNPNQ